jgi:hypothetical protein
MTPGKLGIGALRTLIMGTLSPIEQWQLARQNEEPPKTCFVVGPPRSGTTLLYELMITRYRFAFLSNLAHRLYLTPSAATLLGRNGIQQWQGNFESAYGHIEGWAAPNEGGWIWNRWFHDETSSVSEPELEIPMDTIRHTIQALCNILDGPFLNKNVMHSVHMLLLDRIFPGCLFVHLKRDPIENVRSILRARETEAGPEVSQDWWSVKPREWRRYRDASRAQQAAAQVLYIHRNIEADADILGPKRRIVVDYADVCADPRGTLDRIGEFLSAGGIGLRDHTEIPRLFERSTERGDPPSLRKELFEAISVIETDIGLCS